MHDQTQGGKIDDARSARFTDGACSEPIILIPRNNTGKWLSSCQIGFLLNKFEELIFVPIL